MKKFKIFLWPGCGHLLDEFEIEGTNEIDALYNLIAKIVNDDLTKYFLTVENLKIIEA